MDAVLIVHILAMVLGLGGATYVDMLTFFFAKDFHISSKEASVLRFMSKVIFISAIAAFLSGVVLFMQDASTYLARPRFMLKMVAFVVMFVNGVFLHSVILPRLVNFSLRQDQLIGKPQISLRRIAFASGAVSIVSWYTIFLAAMIKTVPYNLGELIGGYLITLLLATNIALFVERIYEKLIR